MPRTPPIYSDFFDQLLTEDVEELLARFQQTESVRYEVFSDIWRQMSFSDIFSGITSTGEMKRFCRITLATAMKYFLLPYSYQIRVGGLYLMFGFYHTQLAVPPVRIRLPLKDWGQVQKFLKDSVDSGHHDVLYVYRKLVWSKAIDYTAMPHLLTFQKQRKPKKEVVCAEFLGRSTAVQELIASEMLEELTNIQSLYEKMKKATEEVSCHVTITHKDFGTRLRDCMTEFITWQERTFSQDNKGNHGWEEEEKEDEKPAEVEPSRRAMLLASIKQKSYSNFQEAPKSRRHRQAETVDSSSSGAEQVQESASLRRKRPPSLRARTWKNLGKMQEEEEETKLQAWLLSAPEQERVPVKRINQGATFKP